LSEGLTVTQGISPAALRETIIAGGELALLDLREGGVFADGHLLFAISMPLSRLEFRIDGLVPRRDVPIVLCADEPDDDGLIAKGATRLAGFGYTDLSFLEGGLTGWAEAGFEVFSGVNVPSKAFGEFIETTYDTPRITADQLQAMADGGENFIILDSRPFAEFHRMNIPGGIDVPGCELVYRVADMAPDPETTVVVNCAGRTRSIIGAQSLINAGIPNRVIALENGTMGWHLAGYVLERGQDRMFAAASDQGAAQARSRADAVAARFAVPLVDPATLSRWRAEAGRTTFLLDVRDAPEYAAGHLAGAIHAPGGQLVQATDEYVGVRGARLVLTDNDGARAKMTASWLIQMDWRDVHVLEAGGETLETGPYRPRILGLPDAEPDSVSVEELAALLDAGEAVVADLANSLAYYKGHIPGAWFAIRSRMPDNLAKLPDAALLVLTSKHGDLARLAVSEAAASGRRVKLLRGGSDAWVVAGKPLESGFTHIADHTDDRWYKPYDLEEEGDSAAMEAYLTWEVDLVGQIERDGTAQFKVFPPKKIPNG
jgi:rhodanese-related sulfurtransferase